MDWENEAFSFWDPYDNGHSNGKRLPPLNGDAIVRFGWIEPQPNCVEYPNHVVSHIGSMYKKSTIHVQVNLGKPISTNSL